MKLLKTLGAAALVGSASMGHAAVASYGWEDGVGTVMDSFGNHMQYSNTDQLAYEGTRALLLEDIDSANNSTPNATIAWVSGLSDGDVINASFWAFDTTAGSSPSLRIWAHYTQDPSDVTSYAGSAGGNSAYSAGTGWEEMSHSWTFDSDGGNRTGLAIEVRLYDSSSVGAGAALVDFITVSSTGGDISFAGADVAPVPVPAAAWLFATGLAGLGAMKRRKKA